MGKAQYRKKIRSARQHVASAPLSGDKTKRGGLAKEPKTREETIAVVEKISSSTATERTWSLAAVSNLVVSSASTRRLLLSKNLVALVLARLSDQNEEDDNLVEATGVLRNLAIEGGAEVCGEMYNKGAVAPLKSMVEMLRARMASLFGQEVGMAEGGGSVAKKAAELAKARATFWLLAENTVMALWCLAETSQKAFKAVVEIASFPPFLFDLLSTAPSSSALSPKKKAPSSPPPSSLEVVAAQCFCTLSEDPYALAPTLAKSGAPVPLEALLATVDAEPASDATSEELEERQLLRMLVCTLFRNLLDIPSVAEDASTQRDDFARSMPSHLLSQLSSLHSIGDLVTSAEAHFASVPQAPASDLAVARSSVEKQSAAEAGLESVERRLAIVQTALGLFGEWASSVDGLANDDGDDAEMQVEEEWAGIQSDDEMDVEEAPRTNGHHVNGEGEGVDVDGAASSEIDDEDLADVAAVDRAPVTLSKSALATFGQSIPLLLSLAEPTPASFRASTSTEVVGAGLIPAGAPVNDHPQAPAIPPLVASLVSSIHIKSVEALTSLLITLGRIDESREASPSGAVAAFAEAYGEAIQLAWQKLFGLVAALGNLAPALANGTAAEKGKAKARSAEEAEPTTQMMLATVTCLWTLARVFGVPGLLAVGTHEAQSLQTVLAQAVQRRGLEAGEEGRALEEVASRCLDALGCLARRKGVTIAENEFIGMTLLGGLQDAGGATPVAVAVGALDVIFDVYADEAQPYDEPVFRAKNFLQALIDAAPRVRSAVKAIDKRKEAALRNRGEGALANLQAFIQYRRALSRP